MEPVLVYALYSPNFNKIYIGCTVDLENRMQWHNHKSTRGYTKNFRPWEVVYQEVLQSKSLALKREKELKSEKGRTFIRGLIAAKYSTSSGS